MRKLPKENSRSIIEIKWLFIHCLERTIIAPSKAKLPYRQAKRKIKKVLNILKVEYAETKKKNKSDYRIYVSPESSVMLQNLFFPF